MKKGRSKVFSASFGGIYGFFLVFSGQATPLKEFRKIQTPIEKQKMPDETKKKKNLVTEITGMSFEAQLPHNDPESLASSNEKASSTLKVEKTPQKIDQAPVLNQDIRDDKVQPNP